MAPHAVEWKTSKIDSIVKYLIDLIIGSIRMKMDVKDIMANDLVEVTTIVRIREDKTLIRNHELSA